VSLTFATVAEGGTDHSVLQNILIGLFKEHGIDAGDITPVQPLLDETGRQRPDSQGGWLQVFYWLEKKQYREAFQFNDYVILQLDTDACEQNPYNIPKMANGVARSPEELVALAIDRLKSIIGPLDLESYSGRFHFAIAVHQIECWLLPLWGRERERDEVNNCKQRVDDGLGRANRPGLRKNDVRSYSAASADFRKKKDLLQATNHQTSLRLFCESLARISTNQES